MQLLIYIYINIYKNNFNRIYSIINFDHNYLFIAEFRERQMEREENKQYEFISLKVFRINLNKPFVKTKQH